MDVNYAGLEVNQPDLMPSARKASQRLEEQLGPSAPLVRARWDAGVDDRGRVLVSLELSDWTGSVGYRFAPDELSDDDHMKWRLHRLWGDMLAVQTHSRLDQLNRELRSAGVN